MPIDLNQELKPINPDDPKYMRMLANLQGNILKSHGRNYAVHLFITFTEDSKEVKKWISAFTERYLTSALRQHYEAKEYKINQIPGRLFAGFYLSAKGYNALRFTEDELEEKFIEEGSEARISFKRGMEADSQALLNDPPPETWEEIYRESQIHGFVLLADNDQQRLEDVAARVHESLKDVTKKVILQDGLVLRDEHKKPVEHFGFRDGISQPLFYQADVEEARKTGYNRFDPAAPLKLVLVKDPLTNEEDCFGSYLVYRKLEQKVEDFKTAEKELAKLLFPKKEGEDWSDDEKEIPGALLIGRFRNGVPVVLSKTSTAHVLKDFNNFKYQDDPLGDPEGYKCPFHAHIRKANPRGDTGLEAGEISEAELTHRIARRGITYEKFKPGEEGHDSEKTVGLLFMCFQSSIWNQFGVIQSNWANMPGFSMPNVGLDPIIGQKDSIVTLEKQKWYPKWGNNEALEIEHIGNFTEFKGGEYFFAPSISFLLSLSPRDLEIAVD